MAHKALETYLRTYRRRAGFSQREIAFLLCCRSGSKISRYEQSGRLPNLQTALGYEVIFRVPAKELFAGIFRRVEKKISRRAGLLIRKMEAGSLEPYAAEKLRLLKGVRR
jgi:transcriptional regulator with XRE-family HTH domain